jgi:hypothetical protein
MQSSRRRSAAALACALVLLAAPAFAQGQPAQPRQQNFVERMGQWFSDSFSWMGSATRTATDKVTNFGQEAGVAAKSTVNAAGSVVKDSADAVTSIPKTRVIAGHEVCKLAANGAPDCIAAANTICQKQGFRFGSSISMTTAEKCPAKVLLSGRSGAANECPTETFVSRAVCQ